MANLQNEPTMEKIVNLCKSRGFVFQGSEIYGGLANTWDFGPAGVELCNNIKKLWWQEFVNNADNSYGVDAGILMHSKVWEASGHVQSFNDPKMDCKNCKTRYGADKLLDAYCEKNNISGVVADLMTNEEMSDFIKEKQIKCPTCGKCDFTDIRQFKLMFETSRGVIEKEGKTDVVYLRPETAQGQYVNFLNIQRTMRAKVPFGIGNIGKAFRNEVTPGNFLFRTIEFEQMEHQLFCKKGTDEAYYEWYKTHHMDFFESIGLSRNKMKFHDHDKLAFYAKAACDVYYQFPFGWGELGGVHNRTDYDLNRHQEFSGKNQYYLDPITNEKYIPYIVESTVGVGRLFLTLLVEAYDEEVLERDENGAPIDTRVVLRFNPQVAPYKVCVLPLQKQQSEKAQAILKTLKKQFACQYDESGSIGKRYRRQDEIGTPFCITVDFDTETDGSVTVRERDSMKQERVKIENLTEYIQKFLK